MYHANAQNNIELMSSSHQPRRVLVVDDNEALLNTVKDILIHSGFIVATAESVKNAQQEIEDSQPDIIVCDIMMPEEDGFALYRKVRNHADWSHIPFIFLTGMSDAEEVRLAKQLGVDDYLIKPFIVEDLISAIKGKIKRSEEVKKNVNSRMDDFRKRVIHTLSHEFRTPLVAVNTGTEILKDQFKKLDENVFVDLLDSVQRGGIRLQRLVEDFITLQQIDSGHAESTCNRFARETDCVDLVEKAINYFKDDLDPREATQINYQRPEAGFGAPIRVYEMQVHNVIARILSNAKKFGGKNNPIDIKMAKTDEFVSVFIRDYGPGIPPEVVQEALGTFTQINRDIMEQQGCGLGLSIACSYLMLNNGSIHFRSPDNGPGAEVEIRFPLIK